MKANEPEKLYLHPDSSHPAGKRYLNLNKVSGNDIEYTRTDAFIEKVAEYLMDYEFNDSPTIADRRKRVEEFKKAMRL